jgi:hypothetical protein
MSIGLYGIGLAGVGKVSRWSWSVEGGANNIASRCTLSASRLPAGQRLHGCSEDLHRRDQGMDWNE